MEEKRIKVVKTWPKPPLVREIGEFLNFANFYRRFIKNFSTIAALHTLMLQTTGKDKLSTQTGRSEMN